MDDTTNEEVNENVALVTEKRESVNTPSPLCPVPSATYGVFENFLTEVGFSRHIMNQHGPPDI